MMNNGNRSWTIWLSGIIATLLTTAILFLGNNLIANDKESRQRDNEIEQRVVIKIDKLQQELYTKLDKMIEAQNKTNIAIASLEEKIKRNNQ